MKKKNQPHNMLPEDVVIQILLRLPVKSLLRLKSVCKTWLSSIESSNFISQHIHLSNQENKIVVLNAHELRWAFRMSFSFISINDLQLFKHIEFSTTDDLQLSNYMRFEGYLNYNEFIVASFNGIVCLNRRISVHDGIYSNVVSLWNPATQQFTFLPSPTYFTASSGLSLGFGFGYDVKNNDYKVVRVMVQFRVAVGHRNPPQNRVEVYSLGMDCWKVLDTAVPVPMRIIYNPKQPFRDEIYCWLGWDERLNNPLILLYDFSNEVFETIPGPKLDVVVKDFNLRLGFLREKIALVYSSWPSSWNHTIWVLDEYGVKESWMKLCTTNLGTTGQFVGFSMKKIILKKIEEPYRRTLALFDPVTLEINELPTPGHASVAVYKESLVSVQSANGLTKRVNSADKSLSSSVAMA